MALYIELDITNLFKVVNLFVLKSEIELRRRLVMQVMLQYQSFEVRFIQELFLFSPPGYLIHYLRV